MIFFIITLALFDFAYNQPVPDKYSSAQFLNYSISGLVTYSVFSNSLIYQTGII